MRPARLAVLAVVLMAGGWSCQAFFGLDDPPSGVDGEGGAGSSGNGGAGPTPGGAGGEGVGAGPVGCDCVPPIPSGWEGPYLVYDGAPGDFTCPGEAAPSGTWFGGALPGPAGCSGCSCAPPGATCTKPKLICYDDFLCLSGAMALDTDGCTALAKQWNGCHVDPGDIQIAGSSCVASGGEATKPDWGQVTHACQVATEPESGCDSGLCGADDANGRRCVVQPGEVQCPLGWEEPLGARWSGGNDTRGCSACACGSASGTCSGGSYRVGSSPSVCNTLPGEISAGECWGITEIGAAKVKDPSTAENVSCPVSQAQPQGAYEPTNPVTVCCEPSAGG